MQGSTPVLRDLLLVGGGHAHVHTIKMFGMKPMEGVRVTLITRDIETPYSGMLPGYVAGFYTREESHIDLGRLCSFAGVRLVHAEACGLDVVEKVVHCKDGRPPIRYDVVSLDIGITPKAHPGAGGLGGDVGITAVKPIDSFAARWESILKRCLASDATATTRTRKMNIVVVGGGGGGVELAFAVHQRLHAELRKAGHDSPADLVAVTVIQRGPHLMSSHHPRVQALVGHRLQSKGISVRLGTEVVGAETGVLIDQQGDRIPFDEAIWCTEAATQPWVQQCSGLATTPEGFVNVGPTLESTTARNVFACGDVAHLSHAPRPKAGVFAVRAGPPLTANLRHRLLGEPLEEWVPQEMFLGIVGTGDGSAIASKGETALEGQFLWRLKDSIDRTWMRGYQQLPDREEMMSQMAAAAASASASSSSPASAVGGAVGGALDVLTKSRMRCGGCGSKVGQGLLARSLKAVRHLHTARGEVVTGTGDDAALLLPPPQGMLLVQTIDYFRSFISDPYMLGRVAAVHALSDLHAMNAEPVSALALCVLPFGPEALVEADLTQLLAGVLAALKEERCALVGGHTSEGAELAVGIAAHGVANPSTVLRKGPARAGDLLVLTKALGTGVLLAADMRARAPGKAVEGCLTSMLQSNGGAARALGAGGCSACTDVTGFGLLGHLLEMLRCEGEGQGEGGVGAVLQLSSLPLLDGAALCLEQGLASSLQPDNLRSARAVVNPPLKGEGGEAAYDPRFLALFDPQTSGGLLCAVRPEGAQGLLLSLKEQGYAHAAIIGRVVKREGEGEGEAGWEEDHLVRLEP
jgi:selenide,water dikinase